MTAIFATKSGCAEQKIPAFLQTVQRHVEKPNSKTYFNILPQIVPLDETLILSEHVGTSPRNPRLHENYWPVSRGIAAGHGRIWKRCSNPYGQKCTSKKMVFMVFRGTSWDDPPIITTICPKISRDSTEDSPMKPIRGAPRCALRSFTSVAAWS